MRSFRKKRLRRAALAGGLWFGSLVAGTIGWTQSSAGQARQTPAAGAAQFEAFDQRIGPFSIKNQNFTVVLHRKRLKGAGEETVARMEIRDARGRTAYERSFPFAVDGNHFVETNEVSARHLQGTRAAGILVSYDVEPSTPLGGGSYQVFGTFDGKLVPFSKPISFEGNLIEPEPPSETIVKTATEAGLRGDVLQFRVWTSNVFVIVPVRVDWPQAKVRPAWRCMKMTSRGWQPVCTFKVDAERNATQDELTFVRLLAEDFEPDGMAEHVVVKRNSKVEVLQAAGILDWRETDEIVSLGVGEDLWLKVRIDGKEGWIHTQEDFHAIGLPQAG